jgi:hypothetical protein
VSPKEPKVMQNEENDSINLEEVRGMSSKGMNKNDKNEILSQYFSNKKSLNKIA